MSDTDIELGSLDELLADELDLGPIDDATQAERDERVNRLFGALAYRRGRVKRLERQGDGLRAELESRIARSLAPEQKAVEQIELLLEHHHRAAFAEDPRRKRIGFTNGTLASKAGAVEWEFYDEPAALAWCQAELPEVVVVPTEPPPPKIAKADLKAAVKAMTLRKGDDGSQEPVSDEGTVYAPDGEPIPGVRVIKHHREFTVEPAGFTDAPEYGF